MTTQLHALLAPVVTYERLRSAQNHRHTRVHTYAMPLVHEIRTPGRSDRLTD